MLFLAFESLRNEVRRSDYPYRHTGLASFRRIVRIQLNIGQEMSRSSLFEVLLFFLEPECVFVWASTRSNVFPMYCVKIMINAGSIPSSIGTAFGDLENLQG